MKDHKKSGVEPCRSEAGDDGQGALVERLRKYGRRWTVGDDYSEGRAATCDEAADRIEALTRENAALRTDKERLGRELDYAVGKAREVAATIKRVWAALGNPEFETLHGRTISEVVADWKERAERRLAEQGQAQGEAMTVISPEEWEPCSPSYLERGGSCAAPRVWNAAEQNHYHPRLATPPSPEPDAELNAERLLMLAEGIASLGIDRKAGTVEPVSPHLVEDARELVCRHRKQGGA